MPQPTVIRCPQCHRLADAADRFCGACGATLGVSAEPDTDGLSTAPKLNADRILEALAAATIGEYDIAGELGRGGMAVVFLAHDIHLNRKVAIKTLLPDLLFMDGMDRRFKHEARIAARLDHPNILVIYSVREANNLLFIVTKLVEGLPLSAILKRSGPLPIPVARLITRQVAAALAYAHGEGVIHRDVKPANIMVDRKGNVVVMDFGIAKAVDDANLTQTGLVIGTPAYMSPEQCLAQRVTNASDQYSLGLVAFEMIVGHPPFTGSALEMQWAHAKTRAPSVHDERLDCPRELAEAVARMLAKKPEARWPSLTEVAEHLEGDSASDTTARRALLALMNAAPEPHARRLPTTPISPVPGISLSNVPAASSADTHAAVPPVAEVESPRPEPAPEPPPTPTVTVTREHVSIEQGDSIELSILVSEAVEQVTVAWTSSDASIVEVDDGGVITGKRIGSVEVFAMVGSHRAVCVVEVTPTRYVLLEVTPAEASVTVGERVTFDATAVTTSGRKTSADGARWRALRTTVATVDARGVVEGRGVGKTDVVASLDAVEGHGAVTVLPVPVARVRVDPPSLSLKPAKKARIQAEALDARGRPLAGRNFEWSASDGRVIEVSEGRVRALGAGTATVAVTCEGCLTQVPVAVVAPPPPPPRVPKSDRPRSVSWPTLGAGMLGIVAVASVSIWLSQRTNKDVPTPSPRASQATPPVSQPAPSPPPVSPTRPAGGDIVARSKANAPGDTSTREQPRPAATPATGAATVSRIEIRPIAGTIEPGDSMQLVARALGAANRAVPGAVITWQSSSARVAVVSPSGKLRTVSPGTTEIIAASQTARQVLSVTVGRPRARRVVADAPTSRLTLGDSVQLAARVLDRSGAAILDARLRWSVTRSSLGSVSDRGLFTSRSPGRAVVVASADEVADSVVLDIAERPAPPPSAVTVPVTPRQAAPNESTTTRAPAPPPTVSLSSDAARELFAELVAAINARSVDRVGRVYQAPSDPAGARLWRDFTSFIRDDTPRATMRTATVQMTGPDVATVLATIEFVWTNNAGIRRPARSATFTGAASLVNGTWRLGGVRLAQKFW